MSRDFQKYIVGIDLGTTNSAVSYVDLQSEHQTPKITLFKVPQLTGPGEWNRHAVLPSFLYIPGKYDIADEAVTIPWNTPNDNFVGVFARDHGAKVPSRLVSSAKSWLCHDRVDRRAKILPWGAGDEVMKVSPVEAAAAYLGHIRQAWNHHQKDDEDAYLEHQMVVLTVPASFDEVARDLTFEAAKLAGLNNVTLLEEPLAAFYSWLIKHEANWQDYVKPNELILVCDVGGGTTDFTLISLREVDGSPRFERIAVGDHLILGGDNIDFALARKIEATGGKQRMTFTQEKWKALCHQCRQAKENILEERSESEKITLMGEGSRLIAGTFSATLRRDDLAQTVLDGFFPLVQSSSVRDASAKKGITELGLPFEQEPAITRHLGWFLERHRQDVKSCLDKDPIPDLILFNGGSLKPKLIQERLCQALRNWFAIDDEVRPRVMENRDLDAAVALGAAYYGLVKTGKGVRVGSGSPRGYYMGIARTDLTTDSVTEDQPMAMCIVERGLDEGSRINLEDKPFNVLANQPVRFEIYSSSFRSGDHCGDLIHVDDTLTPLSPIQTVIQFGKKGAQTSIPVNIEAEYTETGSLALWCRSSISEHRWRLQFQLRESEASVPVSESEVFDETMTDACRKAVLSAFQNKADIQALQTLAPDLCSIVDRSKEKWPLSFIRTLADTLIDQIRTRTYSPEHEARWLNMTGFTLRPGFGDSLDSQRMKAIWKIYKQGPTHPKNAQVATEWWIFWRRIAGGLTAGQQRQFVQDLSPSILGKKNVKIPPQERLEIWMAVASMERLLVKDKLKWGHALLQEMKPKTVKPQMFWALSRMGARELLYGSVDRVVPPKQVNAWLETLLSRNWRHPKALGAALVQMARKTGDRARDLAPEMMAPVLDWLNGREPFADQVRCLKQVVPIEKQEENQMFGEDLPMGFILHTP